MKRPKPIVTQTLCDTCGLSWDLHVPNRKGIVEADECVRLLKAELSRRPQYVPQYVPVYPRPWVNPLPVPWYGGVYVSGTNQAQPSGGGYTFNATAGRPQLPSGKETLQ